jgi:hypothetical protein
MIWTRSLLVSCLLAVSTPSWAQYAQNSTFVTVIEISRNVLKEWGHSNKIAPDFVQAIQSLDKTLKSVEITLSSPGYIMALSAGIVATSCSIVMAFALLWKQIHRSSVKQPPIYSPALVVGTP